MKQLVIMLVLFSLSGILSSQIQIPRVPEALNYQAVIRDESGALVKNSPVRIKISIIRGFYMVGYTTVFSEIHYTETNTNGLITLAIGYGEEKNGSIKDIDWSRGLYSLLTETDPSGGNNFTIVGAAPLLTVPYAFHAATADSIAGGNDASVLNEIQALYTSETGDTLFLSQSNWVIIPGISEVNPHSTIVEDEFTSPSLEGNPMGDPAIRKITVYLPEGYESGQDFPVVYLLHGIPFGHRAYIDKQAWYNAGLADGFTPPNFPAEGFKVWIDNMIRIGEIQEMIIVMPDATSGFGWSMYSDSELNGNYEDFITKDLVAHIDGKYKTRTYANGRAIMGHCAGGYGALMLAMKNPNIFSVVAGHSPLLNMKVLQPGVQMVIDENPAGMQGPDPEKFFTSSFYAFCAAWSPNLDNPPFYVDLPFIWPDPTVFEPVWERWLEHDATEYFRAHLVDVEKLKGIYLDFGTQDELGFNNEVNWANMAFGFDVYSIDHDLQFFDGTHYSRLYERMEISLKYISDRLK